MSLVKSAVCRCCQSYNKSLVWHVCPVTKFEGDLQLLHKAKTTHATVCRSTTAFTKWNDPATVLLPISKLLSPFRHTSRQLLIAHTLTHRLHLFVACSTVNPLRAAQLNCGSFSARSFIANDALRPPPRVCSNEIIIGQNVPTRNIQPTAPSGRHETSRHSPYQP